MPHRMRQKFGDIRPIVVVILHDLSAPQMHTQGHQHGLHVADTPFDQFKLFLHGQAFAMILR